MSSEERLTGDREGLRIPSGPGELDQGLYTPLPDSIRAYEGGRDVRDAVVDGAEDGAASTSRWVGNNVYGVSQGRPRWRSSSCVAPLRHSFSGQLQFGRADLDSVEWVKKMEGILPTEGGGNCAAPVYNCSALC